ncbi:ATP-dependent (S)-NAD(P)H-hydrate dehydratase-like [Pectinophora gossypiella]|uniref:ATP-dependent (S)-NAD(P)H-hydrate dehydratase-like n=1 Tax=Pectinophora gossypiella TaxID=13191 RepID=UPI00214E1B8B|nr:ATP-dependent (S)-NAD(P)H-hydrate dehydratase-like [Pectinophora gossypiella]
MTRLFILLFPLLTGSIAQKPIDDCIHIDEISISSFSKFIVPSLDGKHKGEAGKVGVIGGSVEYTGAPYFAAISALKAGADLVYVITTDSAAPVIKTYSPDLIVYPYLHKEYRSVIHSLLPKMDVVVIGPGLGRENETLSLIYDIISTCKDLLKPLVIDADGLYAISRNVSIIKDYPSPGVILTPNHYEAERLKISVSDDTSNWYRYWGDYVSILVKDSEDQFHSNIPNLEWHVSGGGTGRRAGGQGDILSGILATLYNWSLKANLCVKYPVQVAQSLACYVASNLTRTCNFKAYLIYGRSMTASDMINKIHVAFEYILTRD